MTKHNACLMTLFLNFSCCISITCYNQYCLNDNEFINKKPFFCYLLSRLSQGCVKDNPATLSIQSSFESQIQLWLWLMHLHNKMQVQWEGSLNISTNKSLWIWKTGDLLPLVALWCLTWETDRQILQSSLSVSDICVRFYTGFTLKKDSKRTYGHFFYFILIILFIFIKIRLKFCN